MEKTIGAVRAALKNCHYWAEKKGSRHMEAIIEYATELFEFFIEPLNLWYCEEDQTSMPKITEEALLNGAHNWLQYSRDGNSLFYNRDICHRLVDYVEWNRYKNGEVIPSDSEDWLDLQSKYLQKAARLLMRITNA